jgi:dephospho-CoA kinase
VRLVVGLTGGIGSGKTTLAARFAALGATVVDTDAIAHELTGPAGAAVQALREAFGARFITADGALDRAAMRTLAFEDPAARERLEAILHPQIRARCDAALASAGGPYVIAVVPLLFETRAYLERVGRTLVVDCAEELQVARTVERSHLAAGQVRAIMAAQWPRWRRLQAADDVAWNGAGESALDAQCTALDRAYRERARAER